MKAAALFEPMTFRIVDWPFSPENAGPGELIVRVKAAAVCGTDVRMWRAGSDAARGRILGHEIAGVVASVGEGVSEYRPGERVSVAPNFGCGVCDACVAGLGHMCDKLTAVGINLDGGFAEYVRVPADAVRQGNVARLGGSISYEEAAIVEPLACAYNGFEALRIGPGDRVLIVGAGPIGIMHALLARMAGAAKVLMTDLSPERLEACRRCVDLDGAYQGGDLAGFVRDQTRGAGVDALVTACPSPAAQAQSLELAAPYGRINFFGGLAKGQSVVPLDTNLIHYKALTVTGTTRSTLAQYRKCLALVESGVLKAGKLITDRFALDEIDRAFSRAAAAEGLKSVIIP